jgi:hypothetical protein
MGREIVENVDAKVINTFLLNLMKADESWSFV